MKINTKMEKPPIIKSMLIPTLFVVKSSIPPILSIDRSPMPDRKETIKKTDENFLYMDKTLLSHVYSQARSIKIEEPKKAEFVII